MRPALFSYLLPPSPDILKGIVSVICNGAFASVLLLTACVQFCGPEKLLFYLKPRHCDLVICPSFCISAIRANCPAGRPLAPAPGVDCRDLHTAGTAWTAPGREEAASPSVYSMIIHPLHACTNETLIKWLRSGCKQQLSCDWCDHGCDPVCSFQTGLHSLLCDLLSC